LKLYVISDTHGEIDKAVEVCNKLHSVDLIIHLGDMELDARNISERTGKTVISVRGNSENSCDVPYFYVLETEYGKIFLTHGHQQGVKVSLHRLLYQVQELGCKAAFFGHTHSPVFIEENGIYLLNPGSLTIPFPQTSPSFAVVNISENNFSASIGNCPA
jgi:putative phosphoesterase